MTFENILFVKADGVATITINRPPYNVVDIKTTSEMRQAFDDAQEDGSVKVIVVTGAGTKAFSAGVDVRDHSPDLMDQMLAGFDSLCYQLLVSPKPTVAVVNGIALGGGCEIAISCDMVIASDRSQLGQPEIKVGVYPSVAVALFPYLIPHKKAIELLLTGDNVSAAEARSLGLVNVVVPEEQLDEAVRGFLARLTDKSSAILQCTKRAYFRALDRSLKAALESVESDYKSEMMKTEDAVEGINAFLERRKPVWKDR